MTPERWKQVSQLYEAARVRPVNERAAFLVEACGSDTTLRHEVQSLLDQPTSSPRFEELTPSVVTHAMGDVHDSALTGRRFGDYLVGDRIDSGGMGDVYRARDTRLGRDVAIKVLQPAFADDPDRLARFEREARLLAALDHPHIGTIYGVEESNGTRALVLALVDGETLAERLARGAIPMVEALEYTRQIADALEAAHAKGIIHRDLKPANIKITPSGVVKVLDFGLAKEVAGICDPGASQSPAVIESGTRDGVILGTVAYMSPEQARGQPVDRRTDIWAFGCVLFEMLTGTRAFSGDRTTDTLVSVLSEEPKWHRLHSNTPAAVRRLLRRCLQKEASARLRDLGDAQIELREAMSPPAVDENPTPVTSDSRRVRRAALWGAAVVATGVASGLGVWSIMQQTEGPPAPATRLMIALPATAPIVRPEQRRGPTFDSRRSLAISGDGSTVVYVGPAERPRTSRLYVRSLDAYEARPLDGTEGASVPFFSPDGQSVGFFAAGRLKRAFVDGGGTATICDAPEDTGGSGGTWGSDDTIVFAVPTNARTGLFRVSAYGGTPEVLTTPDRTDEGGHGDPAFIPGTRAVLFATRQTKVGVPAAVMIHSLTTGQTQKLRNIGAGGSISPPWLIEGDSRPKWTATGHLVFRRGFTIVAAAFRRDTLQVTGPLVPVVQDVDDFDISPSGRIVYLSVPAYGGRLVWVDRHGSSEPILDQDQRFGRPRLSPNGSQLVVEVFRGARSDIGVYRFSSRILTLLTTDGISNSPYWHPDGRRIVFRAPKGLFWQLADGTAPAKVLVETSDPAFRSASLLAPGVFSPPNGSPFLFVVHGSTATSADIFALDLGRGRRIEPIVQRAGNQWAVRVSPEGKWVSYASDETGRFEVYIEASTPGQAKYQVSNDGGSEAVWSPAGNELFYRVGDRMMAVPIRKNPDSPIGVPQVLFTGRYLSTDLPQFDVTSDGQRFVMVKPVEDELDARTIRILDGWFDELQRRVPTK